VPLEAEIGLQPCMTPDQSHRTWTVGMRLFGLATCANLFGLENIYGFMLEYLYFNPALDMIVSRFPCTTGREARQSKAPSRLENAAVEPNNASNPNLLAVLPDQTQDNEFPLISSLAEPSSVYVGSVRSTNRTCRQPLSSNYSSSRESYR
jgi:hypothetical protein